MCKWDANENIIKSYFASEIILVGEVKQIFQ